MPQVTEVTVEKRILMQLGIPFFMLVSFVVAIIIFGTLYFASQLSVEGSDQSPKSIATSLQTSTQAFIETLRAGIEEASAAQLTGGLPNKEVETNLRTLLSSNSVILTLTYFDESGNRLYELHKSRAEDDLLERVFNGSTLTALARQNPKGHIAMLNTKSQGTYFIWAYPRYDESENFIGAIAIGIDATAIKKTITEVSAISPVRIQVVDNKTITPLISTDTLQVNTASFRPNTDNLRLIFEGNRQDYGYILGDGTRIEGRWEPIEGTGWNIIVENFGGGLLKGTGKLFAVATVAIVIFVILVFYYFHILNLNLILPLRSIEKTIHYFKTGDYSEPVEIKTKNEFIAIAEQLNSMSKHIEENTSERVSQLKKVLSRQNTDTKLLIEKDVELRDKGQKLKELDKAKTMFVSVAAHQMRTPLAAIKWAIKLVMDGDVGPVNAEQKEYLNKGYESTTRMINLINDLLDVDKIESDKLSYSFMEEKLEDILQSIVDELTPAASEKGVNLRFKKESDTYPTISADQVKLRNSLQNLIDNAIKYTIGGGDVTVNLGLDKDTLKLTVIDNGIGIPLSEQSKVFGKFFRAKNAVKQETDGSGLGLFIVKKIIEKHNGKIEFKSQEGHGTTFSITIPSKDAGGVQITGNTSATSFK